MEGCVGNIPSAMEGCVGNIPAHQEGHGGMRTKYSCTCVCECYGEVYQNVPAPMSINIPVHESGMEECVSKASLQGQCTFLKHF